MNIVLDETAPQITKRNERGVTTVEYAVMIVLVAIAVLLFGARHQLLDNRRLFENRQRPRSLILGNPRVFLLLEGNMKIEGRLPKTSETGTSALEAALILLMFFMLVFGIFEAGRFMNTRQILTNAAREGARVAVAPLTQTNTLPNNAAITARVDEFLATGNITGATTVVAPVNVVTGLITTSYTQVTVSKPYTVLTVGTYFSALNVTVQGVALMRNETSN